MSKHDTTKRTKLQAILEMEGFECRSYSGRGMYGDRCLGVDLARSQGIGRLVATLFEADLSEDERLEIAEHFSGMQMDSMGLGTIVYFPGCGYFRDERKDECPECGEADLKDGECPECGYLEEVA